MKISPPILGTVLGYKNVYTDGKYLVDENGMKIRYLTDEELETINGLAGIVERKIQAVQELQKAEIAYQEFLNKTVEEVSK